jgi:MYXO-CTERM domain-containing protein
MKSRFLYGASISLGLLLSQQAFADVHFMKIVEVFPGTTAQPDAQYVMLQMHFSGQNKTKNALINVFDANNLPVVDANNLPIEIEFLADVAGAGNQSRILIATQSAEALFGITADLIMPDVIPLTGGKICFFSSRFNFNNIDCVTWGDFATGSPFNTAVGLELDKAMSRKLDNFGAANTLDGDDDTNVDSADFISRDPNPFNNAGAQGNILTCGNNTVEGIEACDGTDLNGQDCTLFGSADPAGLLCNADCFTFNTAGCVAAGGVCGNGFVEAVNAEECDDGNTTNDDGCSANCIVERKFECNGQPSVCAKGCSVDPSSSTPVGLFATLVALGFAFLGLRRRQLS